MQQATRSQVDVLQGHARYERVKDIGQGSFGFVQLCQDKQTGESVAIKFLDVGNEVNKHIQAEVFNLNTVRYHPHIVQLREVCYIKGYVALVMEYVPGGTLAQFVYRQPGKRVTEPLARWIFQQIIIALDYCHKHSIVNRDIKLDNILVSEMPNMPGPLVKICDFGASKAVCLSKPRTMVGTAAYVSPEILQAQAGRREYDGKQADLWSSGVMLYAMLFGRFPFEDPDLPPDARWPLRQNRMLLRIAAGQWSFPVEITDVSDTCKDLITRILVSQPEQRATIRDIVSHPWFATALPPGALDMNQNVTVASNSESDVTHIVQALMDAAHPDAGPGLSDADLDALLDDVDQDGLSMGSKITYSIEPNQKFEYSL